MHKTGLAVWMLAACAFAQVKPEDILKSPNADWLTYAGDYRGTRHSPLKQITTANVSSLVPKWVYHVPKATKLEASPLVHQGVMYVTAPNEVRALDARTGRLAREWKDGRAEGSEGNPGAGLVHSRSSRGGRSSRSVTATAARSAAGRAATTASSSCAAFTCASSRCAVTSPVSSRRAGRSPP